MSRRDFLLILMVSLIWGSNFVVTKSLLGTPGAEGATPPFLLAALRFSGVAIVLIPFLRPAPKRLLVVVAYGLAVGAVHFGCLYLGLRMITPSTAAVVFPMYLPMTVVLSVIFLGERLTPRRVLGSLLAVLGVGLIGLQPGALTLSAGVIFVLLACLAGAVSAVLNRALKDDLGPLQSQAWTGLVSVAPLWMLTLVFETGQGAVLAAKGPLFYLALAHVVLVVGVLAHSVFFLVMTRNDVSVVTPLSLMSPLWGVIFGVTLMGDPVGWRLLVGGGLILAGVIPIALETPKSMARAIAAEAGAR